MRMTFYIFEFIYYLFQETRLNIEVEANWDFYGNNIGYVVALFREDL
jgi:hypothetical protein